ncbi:hypothetical protein OV203_43795 [Nannocystis sp. ILAH1]|uniref:hypothetical protein n=1 Tax=Nannocystis sp. ILAH1 TaxID=2996789 RepID=UPI00226D53A9|nr:hypothetical protein [Nannocystis sp. ILAH1]MCY0986309.1 hypothetical protein [Nannocystis sp. ILAH1]MCY0994133.1 hypothetical protein [Nannocystis sp. ILAH1]
MFTARVALVTAAMVVAPATLGCAKKTPPPNVVVVDEPQSDGAGSAPGEGQAGTSTRKPPAGKPLKLRATLHGAGDLMTLVKQTTTAWTPKQPIDPAAQIQAMLLQMGFGPGLWASLDLAGPFAVDATFFAQDPSNDLKLAGTLAAVSAKGVMDGMPSGQRPQPLGNGLWELVQGELRVLLREKPKALEFALSNADLERAAGLAEEAGQGRRLRLRGTDLPPGMLETSALSGLPAGLRRQVLAVLREATAGSLELDAGTDRDLVLQLSADAPFSRLGLSPLGPARTAPTGLEAVLPASPALVVAMPWGTPEVLHTALDKGIPLSQIPAPFDVVAKDAIAAAHAVLDQVQSDVVFALYLSPKGEATAVLAANVKDEAGARAAIRGIEQALAKGFAAFDSLTGEDKSAKINFTLKTDGAKAGPVKGDLLTIPVPKNMAKEAADLEPFLVGKKKLEAASFVTGNLAVFTIGAGATKVAGDIGGALKGRKTSLGADAGLRLARAASQGCHFCVSVDPAALLRLSVLSSAEARADKARLKKIETGAAAFTRIGGAVGVGVKLDPNLGSLAVGVPKAVLVPSPADAAQLGELFGDKAEPARPNDKPLSNKGAAREPTPAGPPA